MILIIQNFGISHNLQQLMSEWRTSRVDFNFKVDRLNFEPPPPQSVGLPRSSVEEGSPGQGYNSIKPDCNSNYLVFFMGMAVQAIPLVLSLNCMQWPVVCRVLPTAARRLAERTRAGAEARGSDSQSVPTPGAGRTSRAGRRRKDRSRPGCHVRRGVLVPVGRLPPCQGTSFPFPPRPGDRNDTRRGYLAPHHPFPSSLIVSLHVQTTRASTRTGYINPSRACREITFLIHPPKVPFPPSTPYEHFAEQAVVY